MTSQQINKFFALAVGSKVLCNGYEGTIQKIHTGQLAGMADVCLARGIVCVDLTDLKELPVAPIVETYQILAGNGKPIRRATRVTFPDGEIINFTELILSKKSAIDQAIVARRFVGNIPFPLSAIIVEPSDQRFKVLCDGIVVSDWSTRVRAEDEAAKLYTGKNTVQVIEQ